MMTDQKESTRVSSIVHTVRPSNRSSSVELHASPADPLLPRRLLESIQRSDAGDLQPVMQVLRDSLAPEGLDYFTRDHAGGLSLAADSSLLERLPPQSQATILHWANQVCDSGQTIVERITGAKQWIVVLTPVMFRSRPPEVLCAVFQAGSVEVNRVCSVLQIGASHLTLIETMQAERIAKAESQRSAALLELLASIDQSDRPATAYQALVDQLQRFLGCQKVALGLTDTGKLDCRLTAVSGLADFDKRSEFAAELEAAFNESIVRNDVLTVTQSSEQAVRSFQTLLASGRVAAVIGSPLQDNQGHCAGSWLFFYESPATDLATVASFVRASQGIVGSRLAAIRRLHRHPLKRLVSAVTKTSVASKIGVAILAVGLICAIFAVPTPYRITCDCIIEPVSRRFIAAPYDGTLQESYVQAGQVVSVGTSLARLDPRELQWELSGFKADLASEQKKRDAAEAREEFAQAQQATLEMERLAVKIELIEHRLDNLELKSPIDGIVIAGDLENSLGAPLTVGQALFEIGPLDEMVIEVAIPESEVLHTKAGMLAEVRLDASQLETINGELRSISPRSEMRDKESVYIAEILLDNRDGRLRPGMKGVAKVISDRHPLGWNLLHRGWESLAMWVGF
jgi:multidrug resistance efflux pump